LDVLKQNYCALVWVIKEGMSQNARYDCENCRLENCFVLAHRLLYNIRLFYLNSDNSLCTNKGRIKSNVWILLVFVRWQILCECVVLAAVEVKVNPLNFIVVYVLTNFLWLYCFSRWGRWNQLFEFYLSLCCDRFSPNVLF